MELLSGAHTKKNYQLINDVIDTFERHRRILVPGLEEFKQTGSVLSDLGWPASKKSNDALIAVCARNIGSEIWTSDYSEP